MADQLLTFPNDWRRALVLVAHPDDPEYGMAAAVAQWTAAGKSVAYGLASSGEAGIEGMPADEAGPIREAEQRTSAAIVGVKDVEFWGFPDSQIRNTTKLQRAIADAIAWQAPDVLISLYGGQQWGPGMPNQRDHIEFAAAVEDVYDELKLQPKWYFINGPEATHAVAVADEFIEASVNSLAAHDKYLGVLDPNTPVVEQARKQVEMVTAPRNDFGGRRAVGFELRRRA